MDMKLLYLRAVEARHKETINGMSSNPVTYVNSAADVPALLAALRETRAALIESLGMSAANKLFPNIQKRAAAALALVVDGDV
jgi:trehalose-6-phosphate synthase